MSFENLATNGRLGKQRNHDLDVPVPGFYGCAREPATRTAFGYE